MKDKTYHAYLDSHERQLVIHTACFPASLRTEETQTPMRRSM